MRKLRGLVGLFPELGAPGGIQRACRHVAAVLAAHAGPDAGAYHFLSLNDAAGERRDTVGELSFSFRGFARSKFRFALSSLAAGRQAPLVFAAHPNLAPVGWAVKKLFGARLVVMAWGIDVWEPLPALRRRALGGVDAVLAISRDTARSVVAVQGVKKERVRLLPLALEPAFWQAAQRRDASLPPGFPQGRILLSVARLAAVEGYKGIDTVIQALPKLAATIPDVQYVIVGDGDDRPRLEALSRDLGVANRVHFLGKLDALSTELVACYANCDVFVLPSKGEGFGLVFLEAMALGKPVIGGAHGGTPDVIEDGVTGFLVPHGDVPAVTEKVQSLLANDALRREIGERARQRVERDFLFERFESRLAGILEELCAS
jgi:glycosyltransferase involved in cell wall biosynthesis